MASLTGCVGTATITDGPTLNIFEWSADIRRTIYDDSDFSSLTGGRSKLGGMADLVGTIRGRARTGTTPTIGSMATVGATGVAAFYLVSQGAAIDSNYKFTGILSQMRVSVPKQGQVEVTATFESSGAVAVNQAEA